MTRPTSSLQPAYFEALYGATPDPWNFRSSDYESAKYAATLRALGRGRYGNALEIGCSIGVFTRQLAARCDHLLALDASQTALAEARRECAGLPRVELRCGLVPRDFPSGRFDLIVMSEVLYYLVPGDVDTLAQACLAALRPGGEMLLCHWLGETDYPLSGDEAANRFIDALTTPLPVLRQVREPAYRLDVLSAALAP